MRADGALIQRPADASVDKESSMPAFQPSVLISDAYGSVGDITFYHRGGKCYYRKRSAGYYPGTPGQLSKWRMLSGEWFAGDSYCSHHS